MNDQDIKYLKMTIALAEKGIGRVSPNPLVGTVIVKNSEIISRGYHKYCGGDHAEIDAMKNAKQSLRGAELYVNLEPCAHFGRTPPCTDQIIKAKIKRVVIGMKDPNPITCGRGIRKLLKAGVLVEICKQNQAYEDLNEIFTKYITAKSPFVCVKTGQSLDGKIATATGQSKWITSESLRNKAQYLRKKYDCIMVGINTILKDNPYLSCRYQNKLENDIPIKLIIDSHLKTPFKANIFSKLSPAPVMIATTKFAAKEKISRFNDMGVDVLVCGHEESKNVDLKYLMSQLYKNEISSVLVEGGGQINGACFDLRLVDRICFFTALKIIGGKNAVNSVAGKGISNLQKAIIIDKARITKLDKDLLIQGKVKYSP
ncbi:MAG: bifunctional diaminohydroxyphosphoribosylaminopyrimidine deaminase/5-amino-6-(5-phosphoribosylamino)uracil reductase RibD [Candidatus Omnitrophica bacterium]|nr:bifunctional diaminohydroxyphosphoribosylaminopyrimidine deaminase/5-amino-6-(5-phosphoribosylamino)uracil reductase RibD [Candidatus Omnitrophota bacterium]